MTELDPVFTELATSLIEEFGKVASLIVKNSENYDPTTGDVSVTTSTTSVKVSPPSRFKIKNDDDRDLVSRINFNPSVLFTSMMDSTIEPKLGWILVVDSDNYTIVNVQKLYSGELVAAYKIIFAK